MNELLSTKCFVQCLEHRKSQITEVAVVTAVMMMTIAMSVEQVKRCWVPEGIYFWLQRKWGTSVNQQRN